MKTREERFWEKVDKNGPTPDPAVYGAIGPCWMWTASINSDGYGNFWGGSASKGDIIKAHRIAWEIQTGKIPVTQVLHKCDMPGCVNPLHLIEGDQLENIRQMKERGRAAKGSKNGNAKLTESQVQQIKHVLGVGGLTQIQLADAFGVCRETIGDINTGKTRSHI